MGAKKRKPSLIRIIVSILIVGMFAFFAYNIYSLNQGGRRAKEVIATLENIIPGLGIESGVATGLGRDPLASISIDGIDIVGVLEIPSLDVMAPVMSQSQDEIEYFTKWLDGSPVKGHFSILGSREDVFRKIASLSPGDRVTFTDVDGVRYGYEVMTQYHLKKWDEGDNDLLVCYKSDDDTYFVVGCSAILSK